MSPAKVAAAVPCWSSCHTGNIIIGDSKGPLYNSGDDIEIIKTTNRWKYEVMKKSNKDSITDADSSFEGADIVVGFSREGSIKIVFHLQVRSQDKRLSLLIAVETAATPGV